MKSLSEFLEEEEKASKKTAQYQNEPKGDEYCSKCTMWRSPNGCISVKGTIASDGWCRYFKKKYNSQTS
jgi:hypothetical protein